MLCFLTYKIGVIIIVFLSGAFMKIKLVIEHI